MKLVDVHCHLESRHFEGILDHIVEGASGAGIVKLITSSITPDEWKKSKSIADKYDIAEFALGVHPWYARREDLVRMQDLADAKSMGAVAIGEIGLDSKSGDVDMHLQTEIFEMQLEVARDTDLPVILHCRGAFYDMMKSIKRVGLPGMGGVVHSFSGSIEIAEEFIKAGLCFSMGGVLTYRNSKKRARVVKRIYPDYFMLETDSPDIPPVEADSKINVPANIKYNLSAASEILGVDEAEIATKTTGNAVKVFGLKL